MASSTTSNPLQDFIKRQTSSIQTFTRPRSAASSRDRPHSPAFSEIDTASIFTPPRPYSPSTDDGRARMFDSTSGTLSLSGASETVTIDARRREQMERMKLPVPSFGKKAVKGEDDKKSEDGEQQAVGQHSDDYGYTDADSYDYPVADGGYQNGDEQYDDEDYDEQYEDANGHYDPGDNGHYGYEVKQEHRDDMMWRDETPSITEHDFGQQGEYEDAPRSSSPPRTQKTRSGSFHYRPQPMKEAANRQRAPAHGTFFSRRQSIPDPVPPQLPIQRPATVIPAPTAFPPPAPTRRQVTIRQSSPSGRPPLPDSDRTVCPPYTRESTLPLTITPDIRPLLTDAELRAIPTYPTLLSTLQSRYLTSRSTPPANMTHELESILKFAYPEQDTTRPTRFFEDLPDDAYDTAGDAIVQKKREIEDRIRDVGRKRRRVVEERVKELGPVAEDRVERLRRLRELREEFRRGVAGLLNMGGMSL
ncbi:hypothetical protein EX30DRAFT_363131 [Ascodesmis nigricans]|uniref:Uncharacterized protein n=1 Tax=Ascodesmis nigricans TaxID=341454 RepID=A0A4V3SJ51_9PEZI|nr:hypothetical protein EX30DRAFT_363131 [Ascodesmis nigricans]